MSWFFSASSQRRASSSWPFEALSLLRLNPQIVSAQSATPGAAFVHVSGTAVASSAAQLRLRNLVLTQVS